MSTVLGASSKPAMVAIGLMSGTSMDGIDVALIETDGTPSHIKFIASHSLRYPRELGILLKAVEYAVKKYEGDEIKAKEHFHECLGEYIQSLGLPEIWLTSENMPCTLGYDPIIQHSTRLHAQVINELLLQTQKAPSEVDVIGYHGQTLYHNPKKKISIIVGDGAYLAQLTQIPVVNDFRRADIQAGGQGAPFAPLYHQALAIEKNIMPMAFVNCGGIANITIVPSDKPEDLIAFDTGPGNGLLDRFVQIRTHGEMRMDTDGALGLKGRVHLHIIEALQSRGVIANGVNMLSVKPPRALDVGNLQLIPEMDALTLEDGCATLAAFTAQCIVDSLQYVDEKNHPRYWVLSGGGWKNQAIYTFFVEALQSKLGKNIIIQNADEAGWRSDSLEAEIFAYLAVRHVRNLPLSYPGTTGVPQPVLGGVLYK
jgi:anhydro-N-acetylmuramic acid kinase